MPDQLPPASTTITFDSGGVRIHTFTAPEMFLANSTHIIESENSLVVVDGQFVVPYAAQFRAYADSLGKPIDRLLLSHAHVDHVFGVGAAFADVEVHALAETLAYVAVHGNAERVERAQQYGPLVADRTVVPEQVVVPGRQVIDGVTYEMVSVTACETDHQLVVHLPGLGVSIVQDLVYSGAHLYVTADRENWIRVLEDLQSSGSTLFLAGHGPVATVDELTANADYLRTASRVIAEGVGPAGYQERMLAAYPDRTGAAIFDIYIPRLFTASS